MEQPAVKRHSRIDVADVLRGFAVMGIVLLHTIEHYNFYSFPDTSQQCTLLNFTDKAIWDGLFFTFGGKAYAIFALLFGFSFFIQDDNQRLQGRDFRLRFCWRLVLLFALGNINAVFFTAEVLVLFSLVGFVLVATCRMSDRAVFIIATVCLLQPLHWIYLILAAADPAFTLPNIPTAELWSATTAAQNQTSFLEMVRVNLVQGQLASLAWAWDNARFFQTAALFMYGMLVGRRDDLRHSSPSTAFRTCCPTTSARRPHSRRCSSSSRRCTSAPSCSYSSRASYSYTTVRISARSCLRSRHSGA